MPDLDSELLDRAVRWCAEAGRHVGAAEVRSALAPLGWDELLAVRALLEDPPPARPLGPHALADLARGAPPDVVAEREREGRYRSEGEAAEAGPAEEPRRAGTPAAPAPRRRRRRGPGVVIRRARDRAAPERAAPAPLPSVEELRRPEGRAVLERLVRRHGARRSPILAELAAGWSGAGDAELSALLDHHGLAHAFERRERDEMLHAVRAAGGLRAAAAERLGLDLDGLAAALARLGAAAAAERIREERRAELRGRATLAERVRLLLSEDARLRDLELLEEFERDLRARLPEHVRALRAGGDPLAAALARSLSIARPDAEALAARFELDLRPGPGRAARPDRRRTPPTRGAPRSSPSSARPAGRTGAPRASKGPAPRGRPAASGRRRGPGRPPGPGGRGPRRPGGGRTG